MTERMIVDWLGVDKQVWQNVNEGATSYYYTKPIPPTMWLASPEGEAAMMDKLGEEFPLYRLIFIKEKYPIKDSTDIWIFRITPWYNDADTLDPFEGKAKTRNAALQLAVLEMLERN